MDPVPQAVRILGASRKATAMIVDSMESADTADNKTGFARIGDTAEPLHEQVHTVLPDETQDAFGTGANGSSDVEDVSALPQQGGRT